MHPDLLLDVFAIAAGFGLLVWGADRFVVGAGATARNLGVAPLLIGLTIVGFATSAPEVLVSITAASKGVSELAIGNALGSNIANVGLVVGTTALVRQIDVHSVTLRREMPLLLAVSVMSLMLFLDGSLSRVDGAALLIGLIIFLYWIVHLGFRTAGSDPIEAEYEAEIRADLSMVSALLWLLAGLILLVIGANALVWGAQNVARSLGVSELVIGLTIVAVGTSLPELAVSIVSVLKGEFGLALGNIIGSNIFNLLAVVGVAALIQPVLLEPDVLRFHFPVMLGFTLVLFFMAYNYTGEGRIDRTSGALLLLAFAGYHVYVARDVL